ncbi:MAG: diguanylate cyclase [Anaerolineales bacterium]
MIILPAVDLNEDPSVLERIESRIAAHTASNNDDGLYRPNSLSYGDAVADQGSSLEQTVNLADHAMYVQKSSKYPPR